jgi:hypothetical protein
MGKSPEDVTVPIYRWDDVFYNGPYQIRCGIRKQTGFIKKFRPDKFAGAV